MKKTLSLILIYIFIWTIVPYTRAYPIFAQQNYQNPRESNGRIVCANCHLAQKPVELEVPQAVLPDSVFEAVVRIPYNQNVNQVLGNGKLGGLNLGAVLILPEGFYLAPNYRLSPERIKRVGKLYFQPYSAEQKNILVVGPVAGKKYPEIIFPILAPNPAIDKTSNYLKYPVYVGGNRGRGQVYPDGSKSNNTVYTATTTGVVTNIVEKRDGIEISFESENGQRIIETVPRGPKVLVTVGQKVRVDDPITNNPNVGGFGQVETEIVLQSPERITGLLIFFTMTLLTQVFLVLKKKQFEKVQLAEINFSTTST
jgi:apocytochrome f